jgi:hypothetical protein
MANRRKRRQRAEEKAHNQKVLDELALALASEGVTNVVAKPVQSPLAFSIQSHMDGSDKNIHWPNQLGWLQHRAGYKDNQRTLFVGSTDHSNAPQSGSEYLMLRTPKQGPIDPIDQMLEDLKDEESAEALPADDGE